MSDWSTSYNARVSHPEAIAKSFVRNIAFDRTINFRSKVLVGPRGIGKTTLLKLLSPSGLLHLKRREGFDDVHVDHLPLYIPADTLWKGGLGMLKQSGFFNSAGISDQLLAKVQNSLFVDFCFHAIISSLQDAIWVGRQFNDLGSMPYWAMHVDRKLEGQISEHLASIWKLENSPKSFLGLKLALVERQNLYSSVISGLGPDKTTKIESDEPMNLFLKLKSFFDVMEEFTGKKRWSLQFDEMEIAPIEILRDIYQNLRSFDQRAVIKFSLFPYVDFLDLKKEGISASISPQEGPDFETIVLSGKFKDQDFSFARRLLENICQSRNINPQDVISYINSATDKNFFDIDSKGRRRRKFGPMFTDLAKKDDSFRAHLMKKNVPPNGLDKIKGAKRASLIRKIAPIVEFRNIHLKEFSESSFQRFSKNAPRKMRSYPYYMSFDQILHLTEQNPRAIFFYFDSIIDSFQNRVGTRVALNRLIRVNVDRFRSLLATQIVPYQPTDKGLFNVLEVVDTLGSEISDKLLKDSFNEEPTLSFVISKNVDDHTKKLLGIAINSGALVVDETQGQDRLLDDLSGARFRISYQLAPAYPLPTFTGKYREIRNIKKEEIKSQPDLLTWGENEH